MPVKRKREKFEKILMRPCRKAFPNRGDTGDEDGGEKKGKGGGEEGGDVDEAGGRIVLGEGGEGKGMSLGWCG
ncbi:hypothetical protein E2C01_085759 [Portunus trituberculatus]|uniref:Uncharacterized protein n=1 Tax=Portunus trituberculatus TaxID=210409 RepID=A0A5B7IYZ6_PORTR|nr:hypothetical protein [Portunus trituberculatus]